MPARLLCGGTRPLMGATHILFIFVSYGIAGVIGPQIAGYFKDAAKGRGDPSIWVTPFIIAGIACLLGAAVTLLSKPPKKS